MAQKTDLNISPYYDDFDIDKNFYKVLFKPGFPVQARELTTLQSILQNQVESFGSNIFKDGSMVIPGSVTFDNEFSAVKLNVDDTIPPAPAPPAPLVEPLAATPPAPPPPATAKYSKETDAGAAIFTQAEPL